MRSSDAHEFFRAGGGIGSDHPSYIARAADDELYFKLVRGECTCILNARQMGKTSLKNAAQERLAARGILLLSVDLTVIGSQLPQDQWYCSVLQEFARGLEAHDIRPPKPVRTFWVENQDWAPAYRFVRGIGELLLRPALADSPTTSISLTTASPIEDSSVRSPAVRLVLAIDEIDKVRDFEGTWSDDFFGAIRGFSESRGTNSIHRSAGFLLIGVARPSDLSKGPNPTPFNIGHRIVLTDFTREEATKLERGFTLLGQTPAQAAKLLDAVMAYTGGHPYLTQRLCYQAALMLGQRVRTRTASREFRPAQLIHTACRECFLEPGIGSNKADDNFRSVHLELTERLEDDGYVASHLPERPADGKDERKAAVLSLYARVLQGRPVRDDFRSNPWVAYLHFAGIVRSDHGQLKVRNRLYEEVFSRRWVRENMPGSFSRAERAAFRKGLLIAGTFAILVAVSGWDFYQRMHEVGITKAENHLAAAQIALEDPERVSSAIASIKNASNYHPNHQRLIKSYVDALSRDSLERIDPSVAPFPPLLRAWNEAKVGRHEFSPPGFPVKWVDFSPDGKYVATIYQDNQTCRLTVKTVGDGRDVFPGTPCCHAAVAFDRSGELLAFISANGAINVISLRDGRLYKRRTDSVPIDPCSAHRIAFNPNPEKRWLAMTSASRGEVTIWDVSSDKTLGSYSPSEGMLIRDLAWDSQGDRLAFIGEKSTQSAEVVTWDFRLNAANPIERRFNSTTSELRSLAFLLRGRILAAIGSDNVLFLWRTDGTLWSEIKVQYAASGSRIVNFDGGTFGLVNTNVLQAWRFKPSPVLRSISIPVKMQDEIASFECFEMDPSGRLLMVGSWLTPIDGVYGTTLERLPHGSQSAIHDAVFTPGEGDLLVAREEGIFWGTHQAPSTGSEIEDLFIFTNRLSRPRGITAVAMSADRSRLALAHPSMNFQGLHVDLLDIQSPTWQRLPTATNWQRWLGENLEVTDRLEAVAHINKLLFSPDRSLLIGYSQAARKLLVWTLNGAAGLHRFPKILPNAFGFAFSPDGRWLITADWKTNQCWAIQNGELTKGFGLPKPYYTKLGAASTIAALNEDEFLLAQPRTIDSIQLLKIAPNSAERVKELTELAVPGRAKIKGLRISPDASILAALTENDGNYAIQLWNLDRMNQLLSGDEWVGPLFHVERSPRKLPFGKVEINSELLEKSDVSRTRTFSFEPLEKGLRDLASRKALDDIRPGSAEARQTQVLLNEIVDLSRSLHESDWERYFKEWARMLDSNEKN